ncbi:MAG TPA: hypothetical protein VFH60_03335, partial [Chloroflexia bacterium]|nr:hypothetical protein [Chloroflexia bacterium]
MRKSREPLDRSDVISIISLLVALFGTLFSGIFAMLAQQSAEEANRIARDANTPSVSASAEWQIVNIELQLC